VSAGRVARVVVITGGGRGIGAATARRLARDGFSICANYAAHGEAAERLADELRASGVKAIAIRAEVAEPDQVAALFDRAAHALGPITALVNNAGIAGPRGAIAESDPEALRRLLEVDLLGVCLCLREAARRMAKSRGGAGGSIVNLSSIVTRSGGFRLAPYVAAKAGVEGLTLAAARELADEGIRVNAVAPGIIATGQQPLDDPAWLARTQAAIPMGRLGTPEEVADAIAWLISDRAAAITGTILTVSGGR